MARFFFELPSKKACTDPENKIQIKVYLSNMEPKGGYNESVPFHERVAILYPVMETLVSSLWPFPPNDLFSRGFWWWIEIEYVSWSSK